MSGSWISRLLSSLLFGAMAFCWVAAGQTASPQLNPEELPANVLNACDGAACVDDVDYRIRWVGHAVGGELFVVSLPACTPATCTQWLIEKGKAVRVLLQIDGAFAMRRVAGRYPVVDIRTHSEEQGVVYLRFEWNGEEYLRTSTRRVFEVNGVECGTREECTAAAEHALKAKKVDRAVRIWERVHGVSWI